MKTRLVLLVLFLLALVATACQQPPSNIPPDPLEAVKKIADTQKDIKTQHVDLRLDLGIKAQGLPADNPAANFLKDFKANLTVNGDVDNVKQDFDLKGALDLGQLNALLTMQGIDKPEGEFVKVGDKMYIKIADKDWQTTDVTTPSSSGSSTSGQSQFNPAQLAELLKKAGKAEKLADETIDNIGTYHFKVTINPIDMLTQLSQMAEASGGTKIEQAQLDEAQKYLKDAVVEVELWVGKEDLFIRQEKIHFNLNLKDLPDLQGATVAMDLLITANTSKINQPVTIAAPK